MSAGWVLKESERMECQEELLAHSEANTSSLSDDKAWQMAQFGSTKRSSCSKLTLVLREYWWIYSTFLLIIVISLQLTIWHEMKKSPSPRSYSQVGGDYTNQAPICSFLHLLLSYRLIFANKETVATRVTQWKADPEFTPLNATQFLDPKIQAKWETLYPGVFNLNNPY
jgi:hypothetical protein